MMCASLTAAAVPRGTRLLQGACLLLHCSLPPAALQESSPEHVHDSGAPNHAADGLHVHVQVAVLGLDGQLLAEPAQSHPSSDRWMPHQTSVQQCQAVQHAVTVLDLAR